MSRNPLQVQFFQRRGFRGDRPGDTAYAFLERLDEALAMENRLRRGAA